jgi:GNAT superfamily N-acetyltransferase
VSVRVRRAEARDAEPIAGILVESREANPDTIPAMVHTPAEVLMWVRSVVIPQRVTWVACADDVVVGVLVLHDAVIDHLYVRPSRTGQGVGAELLALARQIRPRGLELWTFQSNVGARRFYARHGFTEVELTDGSGNEERRPDVRLTWQPDL